MKTIFETCTPRPEVLQGELRTELFAATLRGVMDNTADPVYLNPKLFFENTFPTEGLKTLANEVLRRLTGATPSGSPFIRLETSFGGGKTHNLIALYHLAQGAVPPNLVSHFIAPELHPSSPSIIAGLVGSDHQPADVIVHGSIATRTWWGELGYQIAGVHGYEVMRASDEQLIAPGTQALERLIGDRPTLIMMDELARYLRAAKGVSTLNQKSDLAEQSIAFLMSLIEFASRKKQVCVVVTLADSQDAFAKESELLTYSLLEARSVTARQERVITPTAENEIAPIVTYRLFQAVNREAAEEIAYAYAAYYQQLIEQGTNIPQRVVRSDYTQEMIRDYPFHPEFLVALNRKLSTIPNFQRTRGALRLLAHVIREVWTNRPGDSYLLASHHVDLGVTDITGDLTSRLDRANYKVVIESDIVSPKKGSLAHCQTIDQRWINAGKPPYSQRIATTIMLHSLTHGVASGIDAGDLLVSVLQPGDDPQLIRKSLDFMLAEDRSESGLACYYLEWDGLRYRFKTEPGLELLIQQEISAVGINATKKALNERISSIWKKADLIPVYFPKEPLDIPDDSNAPKLAIMHYDAVITNSSSAITPPDLIIKLFNHTGTMEGFRIYKNNVLFLVADADHCHRMFDVMQRYLAITRITSDSERMNYLSKEQQTKLSKMKEVAELEIRIAITRTYRHLYYPSADAPKKAQGLSCEELLPQEQGQVEPNQSAVVLLRLTNLKKTLTANDKSLAPEYIRAKAWNIGQLSLTTEELRREFAKRIGLSIVLDLNQLKKTVKTGITNGTWIYFDSEAQIGYGPKSPPPAVQFIDDAVLYLPEEAKKLKIRLKGDDDAEPCDLCGNFPCTCKPDIEDADDDFGTGGDVFQDTRKPLVLIKESGVPAQVFTTIHDTCYDKKVSRIRKLEIVCEGAGTQAAADVRALGLAIPQLGKAQFKIKQSLGAEFGPSVSGEAFTLSFEGGWERYKRIKQLTDEFGREATKISLKTTLSVEYGHGLEVDSDQFQAYCDIFTALSIGSITVSATEYREPSGEFHAHI